MSSASESHAKPAILAEHEEHAMDDVKEDKAADGEIVLRDENWHKTSASLVRKLDMTLMPIIWVLYLFNYLDRTAIA